MKVFNGIEGKSNGLSTNPRKVSLDLIKVILSLFADMCNENKSKINGQVSFSTNILPQMSLEEYIKKIERSTKLDSSTLILSVIYIDNICGLNPDIIIVEENILMLFSISIMIAIKYNDDFSVCNKDFAKLFEISLEELNEYELKFLNLINFKLTVSKRLYERYENNMYQVIHTDIVNIL